MASQTMIAYATTAIVLVVISVVIIRFSQNALIPHGAKLSDNDYSSSSLPEPTALVNRLLSALSDSVILPQDGPAFKDSMKNHWARQESEVVPACVVRPRSTQQLIEAIKILKHEYDNNPQLTNESRRNGLFAIRSGGHSPVSGAASIARGVVIDLSFFNEVVTSEDGSTCTIGAGCKWMDVSKVLDQRDLAVVGGRNSAVGVGGLILGGGLSFFSPRFGLVCSNVISYEIILASGCVATASAATNSDLFWALKGGGNNFGVVTRFTVRCFPATKIWSGFLYMPGFQANNALAAFYNYVSGAKDKEIGTLHDSHAAGPLLCFSYVHQLGIQLIAINLVYTKPEQWPICWKRSPFASLWRFWSTCKVRSLTSATDELSALNPPGRRQHFATTTVKNDPETLAAVYGAYRDAVAKLRGFKVKDLAWTLILQPLLSEWMRKGDNNSFGFEDCGDDPLVIVSLSINWADLCDDELIKTTARRSIEQIDAFAVANETHHPFRYLNYCAEWQDPFEGYGRKTLDFLQQVSREYDPDGLFQKGCVGGFKLSATPRHNY